MTDPASVPQSKSAGEFRLDLEQANEAIEALVRVRADLVSLHVDAVEVGRQAAAHPGVLDLISREAFDVLSLKADGGPGSLTAALDSAVIHVDALIKQMKADVATQVQADDKTSGSFMA